MGLGRISQVRDAMQLSFACPIITVGGTNGKGSTCAILEAILLRAGYTVGCHTSPHLLSFNERARINGAMASDADLLPHFEAVEAARQSLAKPVTLTYFEFTTLAIMRGNRVHELCERRINGHGARALEQPLGHRQRRRRQIEHELPVRADTRIIVPRAGRDQP